MNLAHRWLCRSSRWKKFVETSIVPWTLEGVELGSNVLEIGPGYGASTDLLRSMVRRLTCVEADRQLAASLRRNTEGGNVEVLWEDGTAMPLPNGAFDGAVCFMMLHHVPSASLQDRLLAEVERVLRPGGTFAGIDSLSSRAFRLLHLFDTMVVVEPGGLPDRLKTTGFEDIQVDLTQHAFRFRARKPAGRAYSTA